MANFLLAWQPCLSQARRHRCPLLASLLIGHCCLRLTYRPPIDARSSPSAPWDQTLDNKYFGMARLNSARLFIVGSVVCSRTLAPQSVDHSPWRAMSEGARRPLLWFIYDQWAIMVRSEMYMKINRQHGRVRKKTLLLISLVEHYSVK